ncbi:LacI family DNA-binding transcriptional regulator [Actinocatenispora rupis]|uniref:LacI family transcriptional regulator n=1 Tax=Actinocatenispora rupis TaxID=519421 RepID=A0A8J3NAD8_9ACTN|nr:LacI family DNA-binding transcriptional regulator [Actinocatenispora rupis]GID09605.1 LacI family transcriptional regulator [Actinocatenispora rupis]
MVEPGRRPTIADIAREVGVTKGAVSFALNGRPGVSADTRARILAAAERLGWRPSTVARSLSNLRSGSVGLVVTRPRSLLGVEPFYMRLIAGLERALHADGRSLLLAVTDHPGDAAEIYRAWWSERRVDGLVLTDLRTDDPRLAAVTDLGIPTVALGAPGPLPGLSTVTGDDGPTLRAALDHLAGLGHHRIARVSGPAGFAHAARRHAEFAAAHRTLFGTDPRQAHTRYVADQVLAATRELLDDPEPPTAVVYDSDLMAVTVVGSAAELGVRVPADLAVLAWDDSPLCELVRPRVSAFAHDVDADGATAVSLLIEQLRTGTPGHAELSPRTLTVRGSTAG